MTCTNCGTENRAGRRFCAKCAAPLAILCQACGAANEPGDGFCGECAAPLPATASAPAGQDQPAPAAAPIAERRLVSLLFADLVSFTTFAEGRDAEEVRETLSKYFELASDVITRYGGTVEKFIGDAVMAVWGAPTAHEDDAERAVRAGLELVDAVRSLGPTIQARAGVLTGEAAVTIGATNQGMVAGDLVNTASRLQSVAPPGAVLVGEATHRAASKAISFEEAGEQTLKGKASPVPAWRALRVVAEVGGRNRSETLEAPFVGRDDDLRLLKDLFHATTREGRGRLVSVIGPAGIGKTRLAWEFLKYLDGLAETVWFHEGRSPAYGDGVTFWALGEMVRGRAGLLATDDEATTRARIGATLAEHVPDPEERRWIEPALLALLGFETGVGSDQLFGAWRTFFERLAATAPVVLVFEDFHFADSGLLDFVDQLLEWSRNVPIYVATLARPEFLEKRPDWGAGKRNFTSLYLEPLTERAMRELLTGLVPGLPQSALKAIVARADGMPLYAVETVRMLLAQGKLILTGAAYQPTGDLADLAVPETLTALIASRLDALGPEERTLVADAAALGQSFTIAGLSAVSGVPLAELEPRLKTLVRRELLTLDADPRSPDRGQYIFVQALIREVAYNTMARHERKVRHLAAARYFETLFDDQLAGALAAQYLAAYRNAREGAEADALAAQARLALRAAGERAAALGAPGQALKFFRDAIEVSTDPLEGAALLERSGTAASAAARHEEAEQLWREAVDAYRGLGRRSDAARAYSGLADAMMGRYRYTAAIAELEPAAAEFEDLGDDPGLAALLGQLARFKMLSQTNPQAAIETADRALVMAERLDLVEIVADTLVTRGVALYNIGRAYEGIGELETGMRLAIEHGLIDTELRARTNLGAPLGDRNPRLMLEVSRAGLDLSRRVGHRQSAILLLANSAVAALETGEWAWALGEIDAALEVEEASERMGLLMYRGDFQAERGEPLDAIVNELRPWLQARVAEEPLMEAVLANLRAIEARAGSDFGRAARELLANARLDAFNAAANLAEAAFHALFERNRELLAEALAGIPQRGSHGVVVKIGRRVGMAGMAILDGDIDAGRAGLSTAYGAYRDLGVVRKQAMTGTLMATLLGPADPTARPFIDESRAIWERLGAQLWLTVLDEAVPAPAAVVADSAATGKPGVSLKPH